MTNSPTDPQPSGVQKPPPFVQIPVWLIDYILTLKLTGTQHDLLLLLWKLDPYGDRWVEVPPPNELAVLLGVDARTIQRAARRLEDCDLFEVEIKRWKVRNTTVSVRSRDFSTGKEIRIATKRSKCRKWDHFVVNGINLSENGQNDPNVALELAQKASSDSSHTIHTDPYSFIDERERGEARITEPFPDACFSLTGESSLKITAAYREWLLKRAAELPIYPSLIEQWVEAQSLIGANQRQFLNYLEARDRKIVPSETPTANLELNSRLVVLRRWWLEGKREQVENWIAHNPNSGILIDGDRGPVEVES